MRRGGGSCNWATKVQTSRGSSGMLRGKSFGKLGLLWTAFCAFSWWIKTLYLLRVTHLHP